MYKIKEIYFTLQGEGYHTGRPAVFCRFTGCNLWSGREEDRSDAICKFCDTDFWGMDGENGGKYNATDLASHCASLWPENHNEKFVVFTGGEPMLQLDKELIAEFKKEGFYTAVETNGTLECPDNIDWICMSPKANTEIVTGKGHEIKIVHPQSGIDPKSFEAYDYDHFYLQPMDDAIQHENIKTCVLYCKENPQWKLSLQTHKILGID